MPSADWYYRVGGPAVINFSGGRSSAYMLRHILDACDGQLPNDVIVMFCNTGRERPETLDFVARVAAEWSVPIVWLEYRYRSEMRGGRTAPKNWFEVVDHNSASRDGRPFAELIRSRAYLPNVVQRLCTSELKIETMRRYMGAEYGLRQAEYRSVLGIRYDERRRWIKLAAGEGDDCRRLMPMVGAGVTKADVQRYWDAAPFNLGIPSARGNCDLCFLKSRRNLIETIREDPSLADWWISQETFRQRERAAGRRVNTQFSMRYSYEELRDAALDPSEPTLFDALPLADRAHCFCTD